jgi:hypothetical protein
MQQGVALGPWSSCYFFLLGKFLFIFSALSMLLFVVDHVVQLLCLFWENLSNGAIKVVHVKGMQNQNSLHQYECSLLSRLQAWTWFVVIKMKGELPLITLVWLDSSKLCMECGWWGRGTLVLGQRHLWGCDRECKGTLGLCWRETWAGECLIVSHRGRRTKHLPTLHDGLVLYIQATG